MSVRIGLGLVFMGVNSLGVGWKDLDSDEDERKVWRGRYPIGRAGDGLLLGRRLGSRAEPRGLPSVAVVDETIGALPVA